MMDVCCPDDDEPKPKRVLVERLKDIKRRTVVVEVQRRRVLTPPLRP